MDGQAVPAELQRLLTHSDWLRALARRLVKDAAAADDLVQETWLAAMKSPPDPDRPVRPWLAGVVRKLAAMRARSEGRRTRRQTVAARKDSLPSTAELIEGVDTQRRLAELVLDLAEPYRTTLLRRYYQNMSAAEISRQSGVPAGTVRWRLKRGLEELRGRLDRTYPDRRSWCSALVAMTQIEVGAGEGVALATAGGLTSLPLWPIAALALAAAVTWGVWPAGSESDGSRAARSSALLPTEALGTNGGSQPVAASTRGPAGRSVATASGAGEALAPAVHVVDASGQPATGLRAVFVDEIGSGVTGRTDDRGRLFLDPHGTNIGTVYVERPGSFLHPARVATDPEHSAAVVQLPDGKVLSGRLLVDGAAPSEPLALELLSDQELYGGPLPAAVVECFGVRRSAKTVTAPDGSFSFRIADGWSGDLWLPDGYIVRAKWRNQVGGKSQYFPGPGTDRVVELERLPVVRGRVLEADGRTPVAGALARARVFWEDGREREHETRAGEDGRFELILPRSDARSLELTYGGPNLRGSDVVTAGRARIAQGLDLGDLELRPGSAFRFRVEDAAGEPIAGARARIVGSGTVSPRTGPEGTAAIEVPGPGTARLSFGAPGYAPAERTVDEGTGGAVAVRLERTGRLTLVVRDVEGRPVPGARVRIGSEAPMFAGTGGWRPGPWTLDAMVGDWIGSRAAGERPLGIANFVADDSGRVGIEGLASFQPLHVRVFDTTGMTVVERVLAQLATGESRRVELDLVRPLRTLSGIVVDPEGQVLVGVEVEIAGGTRRADRSTVTGRFEIPAVAADAVTLTLRKSGFVKHVLRDVPVPADGSPVQLTLKRGHDLTVHVIDEAGEHLGGAFLRVVSADGELEWSAVEFDPGRHLLRDLPDEELTVFMELGGGFYRTRHDARVGELTFTLPVHGALEADWTLPAGAEGIETCRLRLTPIDRRPEQGELRFELETAGRTTGRTALPAILPGGYTLRLEGRADRGAAWTSLGEPAELEIRAGETVRIRL